MKIVCLLGRSGAGKTLISNELEKLKYKKMVSYTTRLPREGEVHGKDYYFITKEVFDNLIKKNIIIEWSEYNGNYYGLSHPVGSTHYVAVVELRGFKRLKEIYGNQVIGIYIDVPKKVAIQRSLNRLGENKTQEEIDEIYRRAEVDDFVFKDVKKEVDLVVDGTRDIKDILIDILKFISNK